MFFLLLLQTAAEPAPDIAFDLRNPIRESRCTATRRNEIVVCGNRPAEDADRIKRLPPVEVSAIPRAEIGLFGNVRAAAELEQVEFGQTISNRLMFRLKMPF